MKSREQSRTHHIQGGAQATALEHLLRPWLLLSCVREDRTLSDLARELGLPLPKAHYHLTRLVECGLLLVARSESRRGRPIKYYRAIAETFMVSSAAIREQVSEGLARELRRSIAEEVNRRDSYLCYHLDDGGRPRVSLLNPEGHRLTERALDHWKVMRLTPGQRVALTAELTEVIRRYEEAASDAGELFVVHAAFAPKRTI